MDMETETAQVKVIAHIRSDFSTKFGIPRQSGLVDELTARIVFTPPYRSQAALRGLEGFSHLWIIWEFSKARREDWSPTVRPPRLGGNTRMGVRHPLPLPAQPHRVELCASGGYRPAHPGGAGDHRGGGRPDGRHPHL